jgi:hypothetical protein
MSKYLLPRYFIIKLKIITVFTLLILLSSFIALTGCDSNEVFIPEYTEVPQPPDEVSLEQLLSDYMTDKAAADAKYKGKTFIFTEIEVEEVGNNINIYPPSPADMYIISGSARFIPRYVTAFDHVTKGFIVDIIGECQGWQFSRVLITDCWVGVVEGDAALLPTSEY